MLDTVFLVYGERTVKRMTHKRPELSGGEYAVKVTVKVAPEFFKRAEPAASLVIDERHIVEPVPVVTLEEIPRG